MAVKPGWTGRVFEDFTVGDVYEHPLGRTVTQADNIWFTCLTMNTNPIHFDAEYASHTEFKRPLVNSCFTLALVTGQSVIDLTMNGVANLGWEDVKLPHPLFEGDTVYAKSEVLETRESKSRPQGRHRPRQDHRPQPARRRRHRVPADVHDLEARPRAADRRKTQAPDGRPRRRSFRQAEEVVEVVSKPRTAQHARACVRSAPTAPASRSR